MQDIIHKLLFGFLFLSAASYSVTADVSAAPRNSKQSAAQIKQASKAPLQIDAQGGVNCDRKTQKCTAKNNVRVQKGIFVMHCDELTAFLDKRSDGRSTVKRIDARGNIRFTGMPREKGSATRAVYDLDSNSLTLTGRGGLQNVAENTACVNRWWPTVQREDHLLCAQVIKIKLNQSASQSNKIQTMEAIGGALFSTPIEFSTSDSIVYYAESQHAVLQGNVIVDRKEGQIKGPYAELEFSSNMYKVLRYEPFGDCQGTSERPIALIQLKNVDQKALRPAK